MPTSACASKHSRVPLSDYMNFTPSSQYERIVSTSPMPPQNDAPRVCVCAHDHLVEWLECAASRVVGTFVSAVQLVGCGRHISLLLRLAGRVCLGLAVRRAGGSAPKITTLWKRNRTAPYKSQYDTGWRLIHCPLTGSVGSGLPCGIKVWERK